MSPLALPRLSKRQAESVPRTDEPVHWPLVRIRLEAAEELVTDLDGNRPAPIENLHCCRV